MRASCDRSFAALLAVLACAHIAAGQVHADDLDDAIRRSDTIVLARCTVSNSHWDEHARVIVTDVSLAVERSFKGTEADVAIVRILGGQLGSVGMGASHATAFPRDARVVALLRRSRFGSYYVVTSAAVGPLIVEGAHARLGATPVDLDELAQRIARAGP